MITSTYRCSKANGMPVVWKIKSKKILIIIAKIIKEFTRAN